MPHVLVTGATGFIGRRLVALLLARDFEVTALVRDAAKAELPREVRLASGDVADRASVAAALQGVDGVFHLAAIYGFGVPEARMRKVNVEGTRNVLDAAAARGIAKVVYAGSDTSLGDTGGELADETKRHPGGARSAYEATKREAHELVVARMAGGAALVNAVVSTVYGPGDTSAVAEIFEQHLAGRLRFALDRSAGYTFAHVDDVAEGLILAYDRGRSGESYLLSGTPATFGELFEKLSAKTGIAAPAFEIPRSLFPVFEPALLGLGRLLGKPIAETKELLAMGRGVTRFFSSAKAQKELGFRPRSLDKGLDDTLPHYLEKERERAAKAARGARPLLLGLALFDIALGGSAVFSPKTYLASMHARFAELHPNGPTYLVNRTGALWLFFAAAEGLAAALPSEPALLLLVGALRLMDVPADILYLLASDDLGAFGRFGLVFSPIFNACSGAYLIAVGARALRASRRSPLDARRNAAPDAEAQATDRPSKKGLAATPPLPS